MTVICAKEMAGVLCIINMIVYPNLDSTIILVYGCMSIPSAPDDGIETSAEYADNHDNAADAQFVAGNGSCVS